MIKIKTNLRKCVPNFLEIWNLEPQADMHAEAKHCALSLECIVHEKSLSTDTVLVKTAISKEIYWDSEIHGLIT